MVRPHHQSLNADKTSKSELQWSRLIAKVVSAHLSHDKQELFDSYRQNSGAVGFRSICLDLHQIQSTTLIE